MKAVVRFGWATTTYDRAGEPVGERREFQIDAEELERHLEKFRGRFLQTPPAVSAKKVEGRRAYELARKEIAVELAPVQVEVYELTVLAIEGAEICVRAHCPGGTYMRSIAHDLGQSLGCGAHIAELRRMASGEFEIATGADHRAVGIAGGRRAPDGCRRARGSGMMPGFPSVFVDDGAVAQIRNGRNFQASPFRSLAASKYVKAVSRQGQLLL